MSSTALPDPLVPDGVHARTAAATRGETRYADGRPCVHGHLAERYTRNAFCVVRDRARCRADKAKFRALLQKAAR